MLFGGLAADAGGGCGGAGSSKKNSLSVTKRAIRPSKTISTENTFMLFFKGEVAEGPRHESLLFQ